MQNAKMQVIVFAFIKFLHTTFFNFTVFRSYFWLYTIFIFIVF